MYIKRVITLVIAMLFAFANIISVSAAGVTATSSPVTYIDALKVVMVATGNAPKDATKAQDWKELYMETAETAKIIDGKTFRAKVKSNITKEVAGDLIGKALKLNPIKKVYFADTKNAYINTLYELKIIDGVKDKAGKLYFKPTIVIQKTELQQIVDKANNYYKSTLPKPTLTPTPAPTQPVPTTLTVLQPIVDANGLYNIPYHPEELNMVQYPKTVQELEKAILCALASGKLDFTINYPDSPEKLKESFITYNFNEACGNLEDLHNELFTFYNLINCKLKETATGTALTIELRNGGIEDLVELQKIQNTYMEDAKKVVEGLIAEGKITATMTEKEKAAVLFEWVCKNVTYDDDTALGNEKAIGLSHTGYGALKNKKAVCDGYTTLYNLLCRYVGIRVQSISGTAGWNLHMWTAAILDGERVWIDVQGADIGEFGIAWYNFAMPIDYVNFTSDTSFYKWDKEIYSQWK